MAELLIRNSSVGFIKALIFDKDGTLSNSEEYLLKLAKTRIQFSEKKFTTLKINKIKIWILRKLLFFVYGLKSNSISANAIMAIASREQNLVSTATIFSLFGFDWSKSLSISQEVFDEVDMLISFQEKDMCNLTPLISGALDLLISLRQEKVYTAIMTNDTKVGTEEFICNNKLENFFDYVWTANDQPLKPNPLAVIELCKKMNLKPSECALISDANTDLRMAKEAGISIVIGFTGGWINPPTFNKKQFIIEKLNELKIHSNP